jgi:hypothetical protein
MNQEDEKNKQTKYINSQKCAHLSLGKELYSTELSVKTVDSPILEIDLGVVLNLSPEEGMFLLIVP